MSVPVVLSIAAYDAHTVRVKFDQQLDRTSIPNAAAFSITSFNNTPPPVVPTVVTIFGDTAYLKTSDLSVVGGGAGWPKLAYTLAGAAIKNLAGEAAAGFGVTSFVGNFSTAYATIPPTPLGAIVNAGHLDIYFNESLDPASIPNANNFAITADGLALAASNLTISGTRLGIDLTPATIGGQEVLILYSPSGYPDSLVGTLQDLQTPIPNPVPPISIPLLATNEGISTGYYAAQSDIEDWFGIDNVASWSQLDNEIATADETRIARALAYADRQIDRELRTAGYSTPIATSSADFKLLADIAAEMAGVWLYLARGKQDLGGGENGAAMAGKMEDHLKHARDMLADLITDGIDGASRFSDTSGAPLQIVGGTPGANGFAADGLPLGIGWRC